MYMCIGLFNLTLISLHLNNKQKRFFFFLKIFVVSDIPLVTMI